MGIFKSFYQTNQNNSTYYTNTADDIYKLLNEGNLYAISEIVENFKSIEEKKSVVDAFIKKYDFDFLNYI
jgi:hypothetical protein